jgi:hypothetical protein
MVRLRVSCGKTFGFIGEYEDWEDGSITHPCIICGECGEELKEVVEIN